MKLLISMKKATVGMVMLVSLVFIKAYISHNDRAKVADEGRDNTVVSTVIESTLLRADHYSAGISQTKLLAQNLSLPDFQFEEKQSSAHLNASEEIIVFEEKKTSDDVVFIEEEVVPMDYSSNTGYGLLKSTTAQIISKNDRIGKEPLDNGNTISANISKMFPRSH